MKGFSNRSLSHRVVAARRRLAWTLPLLVTLAACGGGSGGGDAELVGSAAAAEPGTGNSGGASNNGSGTGNASRASSSQFPSGSAGASSVRTAATNEQPAASDGTGNFRILCDYSHMAFDDPIVFPNQPGRSHLHTFFGNTGTNASSNSESIVRNGNSTCRGGTINRSAYWVPAMMDTRTGRPVVPLNAMFYYKTGYNGVRPADVRPLPAGLRMIAGDPTNRSPNGNFRFYCYNTGNQIQTFPNCPVGDELVTEVFFPQCWDGVNLDSPDHKSHMAYARNGCPASHPVALPQITFNVHYTITEANQTANWRFSSDTYDGPPGYSSHGDWWNGWDQSVMEGWVRNCLNTALDCHAHLLGNGQLML